MAKHCTVWRSSGKVTRSVVVHGYGIAGLGRGRVMFGTASA
nr:MAG TPA: Thioredoxin reductase [Caudoviricetes sp.]